MFREGLTVKEAAKRLGVSQQRVRAMVGRRQLPADSDTRILLIDPVAVERRAQTQHVPHRSLQATNAWALLALASGDPGLASSLAAVNYSMRSRLRARLRDTRVIDLAPLLRKRAELVWLRADDADVRHVLQDERVVGTGVSVARNYGFDIMAPQMAEIYVSSTTADALRRTYALEPSARANVLLHVVSAPWPFAQGVTRAPALVAALDLVDSPDQRTARAGRAYFESHSR